MIDDEDEMSEQNLLDRAGEEYEEEDTVEEWTD